MAFHCPEGCRSESLEGRCFTVPKDVAQMLDSPRRCRYKSRRTMFHCPERCRSNVRQFRKMSLEVRKVIFNCPEGCCLHTAQHKKDVDESPEGLCVIVQKEVAPMLLLVQKDVAGRSEGRCYKVCKLLL